MDVRLVDDILPRLVAVLTELRRCLSEFHASATSPRGVLTRCHRGFDLGEKKLISRVMSTNDLEDLEQLQLGQKDTTFPKKVPIQSGSCPLPSQGPSLCIVRRA